MDQSRELAEEMTGTATATVKPPAIDAEGRSDDDMQFLKKMGIAVVTNLFSTAKTLRLYDINNRAAQRVLAEMHDNLHELFRREGRVTLRVTGDMLSLNDFRIPFEAQHYGPFEFVTQEMKKRDVASIEFSESVSGEEIGWFLKHLLEIDPVENAYDQLQDRLAASDITSITTIRYEDQVLELREVDSEAQRLKEESNRDYFRTVALVGEIVRTIEEKHVLQVRKAKRLSQQMVDIIQTDESLLMGLASIKSFDAYTYAHSVNVCILAMLMGDRLRLSKTDVARLGVAALFHDIGKTYIPTSIINSTGALSPREWELMKYHTLFGVKELSRTALLRDAVDPMFVALQHHVHYNDNGYPQRPGGWKLRLFSRIVTVADYYDAMTSQRSYQKDPITPDKALRFILEKSGEIFDPFIAKVFIQAMGLYPIGAIVELDTGETAVVTRQNADARFIHRPTVELVDETVDPSLEWETVDLTERSDGGYRFKRSVVRTIHDRDIGIDKRAVFVV